MCLRGFVGAWEMVVSGEGDDSELAENLTEPTAAIAGGATVGQIAGLIWSDATGVDVVSVEVSGTHVAVPVDSGTWRYVQSVELNISPSEVYYAPRVQDLEATGGVSAVEAVSNHFSMPLSGPPPGPPTGPLPPWWEKGDKETAGGAGQGDDPNPVVG
jgi:hypothetical protein